MRWMSAPELARIWRVPQSTVRRWAAEDDWPRTRLRPIRFDPEVAQQAYQRRVPARSLQVSGGEH